MSHPIFSLGRQPGWMLRVTVDESIPEMVVCTVAGEVDMTTAPVLAHTLHPHIDQPRDLLLDLSGVTFLGSHGLMVLVDARKAHGEDHLFALIAPSAATSLALDIIGLTDLFPRYKDLSSAVTARQSDTRS